MTTNKKIVEKTPYKVLHPTDVNLALGQYWKHRGGDIYILSSPDCGKYCLINIHSGYRYSDEVIIVKDVFNCVNEYFILVKNLEITYNV